VEGGWLRLQPEAPAKAVDDQERRDLTDSSLDFPQCHELTVQPAQHLIDPGVRDQFTGIHAGVIRKLKEGIADALKAIVYLGPAIWLWSLTW